VPQIATGSPTASLRPLARRAERDRATSVSYRRALVGHRALSQSLSDSREGDPRDGFDDTSGRRRVRSVGGNLIMAIAAFIRRHPVASYFALTFTISWGGVQMIVGCRPSEC
jgi:hypothetical protein